MEKQLRICHFTASPGLGRGEACVDLANELGQLDGLRVGCLIPHDARFRDRLVPKVEIIEYKGGRSRLNPLFLWEITRRLWAWHGNPISFTLILPRPPRSIEPSIAGSGRHGLPRNTIRGAARCLKRCRMLSRFPAAWLKACVGPTPRSSTTASCGSCRQNSPPATAVIKCLTIGRLDPFKGIDRLIRALAASQLPWNLRIVGEGSQRGELGALARQFGVAERLQLPGFRSDVPQLLADCDVFIQSWFSEGCSVALLEALYYAPLAISTRVGVAAEFFPDWLIWNPDVEGSLENILRNRGVPAGQDADWVKAQVPRFNLNSTAQEQADLYRQLVKTRQTRRTIRCRSSHNEWRALSREYRGS